MRLYHDVVFPRLLDFTLSRRRIMRDRRETLSDAEGDVLEIGFGTGLNLACFPDAVESLTIIDPAPMMKRTVAKRIAAARMPVEKAYLDAEHLPFHSDRFDCVVSTWTLCTIPDAAAALREVHRVLKPGGRFLFLEHVRSEDERVAARQDRWNRFQQIVGCGCNLNRPIEQMISAAGLSFTSRQRFLMRKSPRVVAEHVRGAAIAD